MIDPQTLQPLERVSTGIGGLDTILNGGLFRGGVYLIIGAPGTGKTILAHHICFNYLATGGRVLYATLLAETHTRLFAHLNRLSFFKMDPIGTVLYYISGYQPLQTQGLSALRDLVLKTAREKNATMLIIDTLPTSVTGEATTDIGIETFLHDLQAYSEMSHCTTLILLPAKEESEYSHALMLAEGVIQLADDQMDDRLTRMLEVRKLRGSVYLRGRHPYEISDAGIVIYPQISEE